MTRRRSAGGRRVLLRLLIPVAIFLAWWLLTGTHVIESTTLSTPRATWDAFTYLWSTQDLVGDIGVSVRRAAFGLALGAGIGLVLGIVVGLARLGEELLDAPMQMLRMVPYPAVIFLFIIWFGIGETAKVLLIGLATLFPMYLNTSNGVRNVDRRVVEAARSFGLGGRRLVRQVIVPLAMPSILTGLRFSAGIAVIALVFTESVGANQGIGYLVAQANSLDNRSRSWSSASSSMRSSASPPTSSSACWSGSPCRGDVTVQSDERPHHLTRRHRPRGRQVLRRPHRARRPGRHRRPRRVRGAARRVGQREDHAAAHSGRTRSAVDRRGARARGPDRGLPGAPSRGLHARLAQRRDRAAQGGGDPGRGRRRARARSGSGERTTPGPAPSRVARPSAWPWPGRWCASRSSSCSTSPSPPSTR